MKKTRENSIIDVIRCNNEKRNCLEIVQEFIFSQFRVGLSLFIMQQQIVLYAYTITRCLLTFIDLVMEKQPRIHE